MAIRRKHRTLEADEPERLRKNSKQKSGSSNETRALNYVIGAFLFLLGIAMLVGFSYMERGPSKLFNLLAAGGAGALLSGIGLFICPLDQEKLDIFQNEPNPITVFQVMPVFWKAWLLMTVAAMIAAFVYVANTTVRIGH
jgi:hypothetical protein